MAALRPAGVVGLTFEHHSLRSAANDLQAGGLGRHGKGHVGGGLWKRLVLGRPVLSGET